VTEEEFHKQIAADRFYEWARVHGNFYGTRRDLVDEKINSGKDVVLDLDVQGGLNIKKQNDRAVLIFVLPPSLKILAERLRGRNTDEEEVIQHRLRNAKLEINFAQKYDYVVVNEDLDHTIAVIRKIIDAERHSSLHQTVMITGEDAQS
jgi:guanylate kinase